VRVLLAHDVVPADRVVLRDPEAAYDARRDAEGAPEEGQRGREELAATPARPRQEGQDGLRRVRDAVQRVRELADKVVLERRELLLGGRRAARPLARDRLEARQERLGDDEIGVGASSGAGARMPKRSTSALPGGVAKRRAPIGTKNRARWLACSSAPTPRSSVTLGPCSRRVAVTTARKDGVALFSHRPCLVNVS